jgi:SAM-dependent methyltransferase
MYTKEFWDKVYEKQNWKPPRTESEHQKNIISVVEKFLPENIGWKHILDYWCWSGDVWGELLERWANVDFAEISSKMVEMLRKKFVYPKELSSALGDGKEWQARVFNVDSPKDLPVSKETYNYLIAWTVLHHIDPKYRKEFLDRFWELLKKDWEMIISWWDETDEILKQDWFKWHVTWKSSYTINTLPEYVDKDKFEIEETWVSSEKLDIFDKPRVVRYYLIKKK